MIVLCCNFLVYRPRALTAMVPTLSPGADAMVKGCQLASETLGIWSQAICPGETVFAPSNLILVTLPGYCVTDWTVIPRKLYQKRTSRSMAQRTRPGRRNSGP